MEIKPKWRGWKEGILTEDLRNGYGQELKKGSTVRYRRYLTRGSDKAHGRYEWHYMNQSNTILIRMMELLIEGEK